VGQSYPLSKLLTLLVALALVGGLTGMLCAQAVENAPTAAPSPTTQPSPEVPLGSIHGTVMDSAGDVLVDATVTLTTDPSGEKRTAKTDGAGFFNFGGVKAGSYHVSVAANGFAPWTGLAIVLAAGQIYDVPEIALHVAAANTSVMVTYSSHEVAEQQIQIEEKQRVLGIVPNFYTSYIWDAEPLTSRQKFHLALRTSVDPITFLGAGAIAGIQQWQNDFKGYGQGAAGYFKRFGASYADGFSGVMLGGAIFPSLLHQDPRYFYKGTGSIKSRALYAISTVVITKGDNGRWQPNYSNVLGTFTAAGISNAYYPAANRGAQLTIDNALLGIASGAIDGLLQEFVIKKLSRGVPASANGQK
jgi:Carboxypeptidase regulatory-like domain